MEECKPAQPKRTCLANAFAIKQPFPQVYEDMPIEEFGKAMLRGMGWTEGMGVGRNRKQVRIIV
jgi:hypothetical protein